MTDRRQLRLPATDDVDTETLWMLSFEHSVAVSFLSECVPLGTDVENMSESEMWRAWARANPKPKEPGGDDCAGT